MGFGTALEKNKLWQYSIFRLTPSNQITSDQNKHCNKMLAEYELQPLLCLIAEVNSIFLCLHCSTERCCSDTMNIQPWGCSACDYSHMDAVLWRRVSLEKKAYLQEKNLEAGGRRYFPSARLLSRSPAVPHWISSSKQIVMQWLPASGRDPGQASQHCLLFCYWTGLSTIFFHLLSRDCCLSLEAISTLHAFFHILAFPFSTLGFSGLLNSCR